MIQKCLILVFYMIFVLLSPLNSQSVFKQPQFFKAFYCNLGTKTVSDNGNYVCTSPRVVPQVDKCDLSLMQINKVAGFNIKFEASIVSCLGMNIVSATVKLEIKSNFLYKLGFIIVAIGHQSSNFWVSLVSFSLLDNPATNSLYYPANNIRNDYQTFQVSSLTHFTSTTNLQYIVFITSFGMTTSLSSAVAQIDAKAININTTHFKTTIRASPFVGIQTFRGFVLLFDPTVIGSGGSYFQSSHNPITSSTNLSNSYNIYGPSFNPKCIIGYDFFSYDNQSMSIFFLNTSKNHYQIQSCTGYSCDNGLIWMNIFCMTNGSYQCSQNQPFQDYYTQTCYIDGTSCPISTLDPVPVPPIPPYMCQKCTGIDCVDCDPSDRNICNTCDTAKNAHLSGPFCVCDLGYYRPTSTSSCKIDCSFHILNCKKDFCVSNFSCTQCEVNYGLQQMGTNYLCQLCSTIIPNCVQCVSQTKCTLCINSYGVASNNLCALCSTMMENCTECTDFNSCTQCQVGYLVEIMTESCKSCSYFIPNCSHCSKNTSTTQVYCTLCNVNYYLNKNFTCSKLPSGCSSFHVANYEPFCLYCDLVNHFQLQSSTGKCICQYGFQYDQLTQLCQFICGDGIRAGTEVCDDHNIQNGDGCDSNCKVQDNYQCQDNLKGQSMCLYLLKISIVYDYTIRHFGENKASLYFTVTPSSIPYNKIDWQSLVIFNLTDVIISSTSYSDGILIINIEYSADLDSRAMQMDIFFDPSIIKSQNHTQTINLNALNGLLTYDSESENSIYKVLNLSGSILGFFCLFCYLFATYFHKLIGLETLQFVQLVYFVRLIFPSSSNVSFYSFNSFKYSNGFNDIFPQTIKSTAQILKSIPAAFTKLNLKLMYLENCNTMLVPITLAVLVFIFYSLRKSRSRTLYVENKDLYEKDKYVILKRQVDWIYDNFIFSYTLGLLYITTFQLMLYKLSKFSSDSMNFSDLLFQLSYSINMVLLLFMFAIYSSETINGIRNYLDKKDDKQNVRNDEKALQHDSQATSNFYHPLYVSVYLIYQFFLIMTLNLMFVDFKFLPQCVLGTSMIYLIILIIWQPYTLKIHNYSIIFNQSVAAMFISIQVMNRQKILPSGIYNVLMFLMIALITGAIVLQLIRLYVHHKTIQDVVKVKQNKNNGKDKKYMINQNNLFSIENQIKQALQLKNLNIQEVFMHAYKPLPRQQCKNIIKNQGLTLAMIRDTDSQRIHERYEQLFAVGNDEDEIMINNKKFLQRTKLRLRRELDYLHYK